MLASASAATAQDVVGGPGSDPLEPLNRAAYAVNRVIDRALFRPVAITYRRLTPRPVRRGVARVISNLGEPVVGLNDLLQLHPVQAAKTTVRFVGNSTLGVLGVFDVATPAGLPHHDNGFAVTLGKYGAPSGPYLFIPVAGPSSVRDAVGTVVDVFTDPLRFVHNARSKTIERVQLVVTAVSARSQADADLRELDRTATDPYVTLRSIYLQHMEAEIRGEDNLLAGAPDIDGAVNAAPSPSAEKPKGAAPKP